MEEDFEEDMGEKEFSDSISDSEGDIDDQEFDAYLQVRILGIFGLIGIGWTRRL